MGSDVALAVTLSAIWLFLYNARFWQEAISAMWRPAPSAALFLLALGLLVLYVQALLLLLVPTNKGLRAAASLLFVIAAAASWFTSRYGVVFDKDMIRNVAQTDAAEAADLLNLGLILRVVLLGIVPGVLVWFVRIPRVPWGRRFAQRAVFALAGAVIVIGLAFATSDSYASFLREHKPVRSMLAPAAPIWSSVAYLAGRSGSTQSGPLEIPGGPPRRVQALAASAGRRPLLVVMVVGETARAANFQLGGYAKPTNPELALRTDLYYYPHASSCGTSTAASLPCMFAHRGRADFKAADARQYGNLLDLVQTAGVSVQWRDNNSGCKHVCARVPTLEYFANAALRAGRPDCTASHCHDGVLIDGLAQQLADLKSDSLLVLHQEGSHGPAYFERYPQDREAFQPACHSADLGRCSAAEIVAAYDNTIRYTDHFLAQLIGVLESAPVDVLLLYASDHGESLGEKGVYLHGLPYAFAPPVQKQVPMLAWMSSGYAARRNVDRNCLAASTRSAVSHDNLYHTLLGATGVINGSYRPDLDLLSGCTPAGHAVNQHTNHPRQVRTPQIV